LPRVKGEIFQQEVSTTEIAMVSPVQSTVTVTSTGYVVPQVISKVGAKIAGRVSKVNVKEGDSIKAGAVIAQLDDADQRSSIAAAVSRVAVARAHAQTARANVADIVQQVKREQALVTSGAAGRATLEDLQAKQKSLDEQVKASDSEANASQSDVDSLQTNLKDRTILSPIDGTVVSKPVEVGEMVLPAGNPVAEIADFKSLLVETDVPEARLHLVKKGGPGEIVLDAYPDRRYRGEVVEFGQKVNRAKATIIVKVRFADSMEDVLPDMAARVSFLTQPIAKDSLADKPKRIVPGNAVVERDGAKSVFVIGDGKVKVTRVTLGPAVGAGFELVDGPPAGTKLVSSPRPELQDGQSIKEK
jgi:RND family efflux transporter MFP subunit